MPYEHEKITARLRCGGKEKGSRRRVRRKFVRIKSCKCQPTPHLGEGMHVTSQLSNKSPVTSQLSDKSLMMSLLSEGTNVTSELNITSSQAGLTSQSNGTGV